MSNIIGKSQVRNTPAVLGDHSTGTGVVGKSVKGVGVFGQSVDYRGIEGHSTNEHGVLGKSMKGSGIVGISENYRGVSGRSNNEHGVFGTSTKGAGVVGVGDAYRGVSGLSKNGDGVYGESATAGKGVVGKSARGIGVFGVSDTNEGVHAETQSTRTAAVAAYQMNGSSRTAALFAKHQGGGPAAVFHGDVHISQNLFTDGDVVLANADCAEDFDIQISEAVEAGSVVVLGDDGTVRECDTAYDRRVAGVISGAGSYKPGIVLDRQAAQPGRKPVALLGKVFCKVDARYGPIVVGDMLTTSPTPGHAMRADDPSRSFGAVIGKALSPFHAGTGLVPILVALQ